MTFHGLFFFTLPVILSVLLLPSAQTSPSYYLEDEDSPIDDYINNAILQKVFLQEVEKRDPNNCIARGNSCDNRLGDCCEFTACRCNLWGANCRCQRRGLFQKWGK